MVSRLRVLISGSVVVWVAALAFSGASAHVAPAQKTTNDGIYTKAQADGAKPQFDKICAECHPFTVAAKKKPKDLPLGDEPFFESWSGRNVSEMITLIALTIATVKVAIVGMIFMELRESLPATRVIAVVALLFVFLLCLGLLGDVMYR